MSYDTYIETVDFDSLPEYKKRSFEKLDKEEDLAAQLAKDEKYKLQIAWVDYTQKNQQLFKQHKLAKELLASKGVGLSISENQSYQLVEEQIAKLEASTRAVDEQFNKTIKDIRLRRDQLVEEIRQTQAKEKATKAKKGQVSIVIDTEEEEKGEDRKTVPQTPTTPISPQSKLDKQLTEERKEQLKGEIHRLDIQTGQLLRKLEECQQQLKTKGISAYDTAVLERQFSKLQIELDITRRRLEVRHKIKSGVRVDFGEKSESEFSDGGYSGVESDTEYSHQFVIRDKKVRRRRRRIPKVEKGNYSKMTEMKWSMKDIPKFHGDRRQGETPSAHLMEFADFIRNIGLRENDDDAEKLIGYFMQSLKNRARQWFDLTLSSTPITTLDGWENIKKEFLQEYNPVGSTKEQQIKAWREMKWDPSTESLTDFVYKYKELGQYLGYPEKQLLQNFLCCIPASMYVYAMNAPTLAEAITNLKKGMALASNVMTVEKKEEKTPVIPFMVAAEKNVSFSSDTLMAEKIKTNVEKVMEEQVNSLTQAMEGKMETLTAALDRFQNDRKDGRQNRDDTDGQGQRNRSPYRGNGQWNRGRSPSGGRGGRFNQGGGSRPFCNYCKRDGHVISTCWTLEARNGGRSNQGSGNRGGRGRFNNRPQNGNRYNQNRGGFGQNRQFNRPQGSTKKEVANVVKGVIKELKKNGVEMKATN